MVTKKEDTSQSRKVTGLVKIGGQKFLNFRKCYREKFHKLLATSSTG
jgi:hypothetical protein